MTKQGVLGRCVLSFVVLLAAASCSEKEKSPTRVDSTVTERVAVVLDDPGTIDLPQSWFHMSQASRNATLGLAAVPREELLQEVASGNALRHLEVLDLMADDVFVEIWASYQPVAGGSRAPELPTRVSLEDFKALENLHGAPLYEFEGAAPGGGLVTLHFWAGPDVSPDHLSQLRTAISSLRF
jgi:hypothetical protein